MGNSQNKDANKRTLAQTIDFVASEYIMTQSFQDMKKLSDIDYCNKLVILTAKVFEKNLSDEEVTFLDQRLQGKEEINKMTSEKLRFINKNTFPTLDVNYNSEVKNKTEKNRMCKGIAKFYIKIAHVFSAIVTTIQPDYDYNESKAPTANANATNANATNANANPSANAATNANPSANANASSSSGNPPNSLIPTNPTASATTDATTDAQVNKPKLRMNNLCSQRLNALLNGQVMTGEKIVIKPNICKMNLDKSNTLYGEPGIPELSKLYNDKYDFGEGKFTGMTDTMKKIYKKDVDSFYKIFTGQESVPPEIKTFKDIPLAAFNKKKEKECGTNSRYTATYTGSIKDKLFKAYADHIKTMMQHTEESQDKLLKQIDLLFTFDVDVVTGKRLTVIRPDLTDNDLQKIVENTRNIIVNLYITCEEDFLKGLNIFEAIVENQIGDTTQAQSRQASAMAQNSLNYNAASAFISSGLASIAAAPAKIVSTIESVPASAPITSAPITSAPITSAPAPGPTPLASAPITSAPIASAPIASAPIASAPAIEPVKSVSAPAPITSAPAPITSASAPSTAPAPAPAL